MANEQPKWKRIAKGEKLPCHSFLRKKNGEILKLSSFTGVKVGQDAYYLPVDEVINVIKDYPIEESKDEMIKEKIIATIHLYYGEPLEEEAKEMIAWLEKQVEHAKFRDSIQVGDKVTRNEDGVLVNLSQLNRVAKKDEKQGEQKLADKVEPKFKVDDWINGYYTNYKVISVNNKVYVVEDVDGDKINILFENEKFHRLWTIQDAKAGDVLATEDAVFIFKHIDKTGLSLCKSYCEVIGKSKLGFGFDFSINGVYPATKEQYGTLMKAMTDAGYTFDFEKKELKDIQKLSEWSEEDEWCLEQINFLIRNSYSADDKVERLSNWVKSIKDRVQPQSHCEWSEEDENRVDQICEDLKCGLINFYANKNVKGLHFDEIIESNIDWLKNMLKYLRPKSTWKPSDEQLYNLSEAAHYRNGFWDCDILIGLYDELKKLREE